MKYIAALFGMCLMFVVVWCTSDVATEATQTIAFSKYHMNISTGFLLWNKDTVIDNRVSKKVLALYYKNWSSLDFADNIIISQDTLTPRTSLEDYVQASIGGISYTRWKYASLSFDKSTISCNGKTIPAIMNTFSIYRTPTNSTPETLYFVQYFIQNNDEIIIASANTNQQDMLSSLTSMLKTLSCVQAAI
jgi:hypothetical protein